MGSIGLMSNGFTQKEMLKRVLDKLEKIEDKVNSTHEVAIATNGKVKLHTKALYILFTLSTAIIGWFIRHLTTG